MPHKLLLADDSITIQRVIELTFADEDIDVIAVGDGKQAIQRVQSDRPDIVLADIGMPERDGYEVATFIKSTPAFAHIPVLLLTGAFEPIDEGRARAAGCDGVLVKPFEPQMVISRVKDLIAGRRPAVVDARGAAQGGLARDTVPTSAVAASAAAGTAPDATGSIEDYFDRLDAAFASLDTGAPAAASPRSLDGEPFPPARPAPTIGGLGADLADWDPDLSLTTGTQPIESASELHELPQLVSPATVPPVSTPALTPVHGAQTPAAPQPQSAVAVPSSRPQEAPADSPVGSTTPESSVPSLAEAFAALLAAEQGQAFAPTAHQREAVTDDTVEQVTRRVIERMGDKGVRDVVLEVAERLVREEIARLKAQ